MDDQEELTRSLLSSQTIEQTPDADKHAVTTEDCAFKACSKQLSTSTAMSDLKPFKIDIPEQKLQRVLALAKDSAENELKSYFANTADSKPANPFDYGIPKDALSGLVDHLLTKYDWRKEEKALNAIGEHSILSVKDVPDEGTMQIHFVHAVSILY